MRRLSRYLNTAPLPAAIATQMLATVILLAVVGWPAVPAASGGALASVGWGLVAGAVGTVAERRQQQKATGWSPIHRVVADGTLPPGYAGEDGVGLHYLGTELHEAVTIVPDGAAWWVDRDGDRRIPARSLEPASS